jgi:hypothetical protein
LRGAALRRGLVGGRWAVTEPHDHRPLTSLYTQYTYITCTVVVHPPHTVVRCVVTARLLPL